MIPEARVIVNPAAGGYAVEREWPEIRKTLENTGLSFDYDFCGGVGHGMEIAKNAVDAGCRYIIAAGGDGTINEVANGILSSTAPDKTLLGIISAGTACSFARSIGLPLDYASACPLLIRQRRKLVDVGVIEYESNGQTLKRFFINEADAGFGAVVVEESKDLSVHFGRSINYAPFVIASVRNLFSYQSKQLSLRVNDGDVFSSVCTMVVIANGSYFGGGMRIAPQARPDDGLLDMVIVGDVEKSELARLWLMSYEGTHVTHGSVRVEKVKNVTIGSDEQVLVEADGEIIGKCPVTFRVLPSVLTIVV